MAIESGNLSVKVVKIYFFADSLVNVFQTSQLFDFFLCFPLENVHLNIEFMFDLLPKVVYCHLEVGLVDQVLTNCYMVLLYVLLDGA